MCLTAGSAMLMWIGERITEKGVGNGISIVLTVNIVSRVPSDLTVLYENFIKGKTIAKGMLAGLIIAAIIIAMVVSRSDPERCREKNSCTVFQEDGWKKAYGRTDDQYSFEG